MNKLLTLLFVYYYILYKYNILIYGGLTNSSIYIINIILMILLFIYKLLNLKKNCLRNLSTSIMSITSNNKYSYVIIILNKMKKKYYCNYTKKYYCIMITLSK